MEEMTVATKRYSLALYALSLPAKTGAKLIQKILLAYQDAAR
jgi:hypothetical protein